MKVIIIGGGACIWDDVARSEDLLGDDWWDVCIAVNDVGCHWPRRLDHWVSLHSEKVTRWRRERDAEGLPGEYQFWGKVRYSERKPIPKGMPRAKGIDRLVRPWGGGSSGLFGVTVAAELGARKVVLCGIPMTRTVHFPESRVHLPDRAWGGADGHFRAWPRLIDRLGNVRSMSGRTRDLLGAPTPEWLNDHEEGMGNG